MDDGVLSADNVPGAPPESGMDFEFMDELLFEGCWLETTDGSEFVLQSPSNSSAFFDLPFGWPVTETNGEAQLQAIDGEINDPRLKNSEGSPPTQNKIDPAVLPGVSENHTTEGSELGMRWWIGPRTDPGPGSSVMERLIRAIGLIKNSARNKDVLVQVWVPINRGGRRVLTTNDLPFYLNSSCLRLAKYRDISVNYQFSTEKDSEEIVGLPGRVFLGKVPEWTPDVRFFRSDEYARVNFAQQCDVRGTLALPIFEQGSRSCLGVIEIVMTTQQINYRPELETVCRALEAVDLRSSSVSSTPNKGKPFNTCYEVVLPEIQEVTRMACETHRLPLAQTWASCIQQGREGCRHSDENYLRCVSTVDEACCVADPRFQCFHEACSEHHLLKGQGVAGEAFLTNQPRFSAEITSFGNTEYPLSHHARMFGLHAVAAIRLRSIHSSKVDFVLEFFLPIDCDNPEEHRRLLTSLSTIIQQCCQNLRVVTDEELSEEVGLPFNDVGAPSDSRPGNRDIILKVNSESKNHNEDDTWAASLKEVQQFGSTTFTLPEEKPADVLAKKSSRFRKVLQDPRLQIADDDRKACPRSGEGGSSDTGSHRAGERRRVKAEKTITLEILQRYFAGSLKDAAKGLGVCPTTLKRICRQQGIKRWPSRKIKKVGHSLQKLQRVIDSVQSASGAFQIDTLYKNFQELSPPNQSGSSPFLNAKWGECSKPSAVQFDGGIFDHKTDASKSSSSCGQSSCSSHSCSIKTQGCPTSSNEGGSDDQVIRDNSGDDDAVKRARSDAELHVSNRGGSRGHKSLRENAHLAENTTRFSGEEYAQRVKITYGDDIIRFRLQHGWGFEDLLKETARQFNISDTSKLDLKYLDDDSEWVLMTCDADLEECIEVSKSSQGQTIKLSLQLSRKYVKISHRTNDLS